MSMPKSRLDREQDKFVSVNDLTHVRTIVYSDPDKPLDINFNGAINADNNLNDGFGNPITSTLNNITQRSIHALTPNNQSNTFTLNSLSSFGMIEVTGLNSTHDLLKKEFSTFIGLNKIDNQVYAEFINELSQTDLDKLKFLTTPQKSSKVTKVTPRQIRQALIINGISLSQVEQTINLLPEPQKSLALIEWEYSTVFDLERPLVKQIGTLFGMNDQQLQDLWELANNL